MRYVIRLIAVICASLAVLQARPAQTEELRPGQEFRDCQGVCPEMVVLPSGEFMMGSPPPDVAWPSLTPSNDASLGLELTILGDLRLDAVEADLHTLPDHAAFNISPVPRAAVLAPEK